MNSPTCHVNYQIICFGNEDQHHAQEIKVAHETQISVCSGTATLRSVENRSLISYARVYRVLIASCLGWASHVAGLLGVPRPFMLFSIW